MRSALGDRQREREAGAATGAVLGPDATPLCFDEAPRDRQPQPGAAAGARAGGVLSPEALEHALLGLPAQADARVLDGHLELAHALARA